MRSFVFPGQGSQFVGMGKDLAVQYPAARQILEEADSILGISISRLMGEGPKETLDETINTQPALYVHSVAAWRVFTDLYPAVQPATLAGHSLGELSALTASGALAFSEGLRLVRKRGELMKHAGEINPGGMAAILGVNIPTLEKVCAEASIADEIVQVANDNCPGQVVISGHKAALERAMAGAKAAGAKRAEQRRPIRRKLARAKAFDAHAIARQIRTGHHAPAQRQREERQRVDVGLGNRHHRHLRSGDDR